MTSVEVEDRRGNRFQTPITLHLSCGLGMISFALNYLIIVVFYSIWLMDDRDRLMMRNLNAVLVAGIFDLPCWEAVRIS
jgi:uncharacterized membrane protein YqjE